MHGDGCERLICAVALFVATVGISANAEPVATKDASGSTAASLPLVTLEQVVEAAKAGAPGLKVAGIALDSARAALQQTRGANGLSLGGTGSYFHQGAVPGIASSSPGSTGSTLLNGSGENVQAGLSLAGPATSVGVTAQHAITEGAAIGQASSVSLSASQTVFDGYPGGRAAASTQAAEYAYQSAQLTYDTSLKSLLYQVQQAYYTLLADQDTVKARQATVEQASKNLAYMQGLFNAQRATKLDVLQVQVTLTQAQLDLRSAGNTLETDRKRLSVLTGWPADKQYRVEETAIAAPPSLDLSAALSTAFQNRQELRTLALTRASAAIGLALLRSQYAPVVSVTGSVDIGQNWTTSMSNGTFTAGVKIALPPIYDGGQQGAQVQQAANQISSLSVQEDQQRQSIAIDVQNALFGVKDAQDRLDLARQNVEQAQGVYELQKAKLAAGLVTTLDVLTAFSVLTTAQVGLVQAGSNYALAILNLNNVMGL